jgi:hypothetical protein
MIGMGQITTEQRSDFIAKLIPIQNHPANCNQDIMTFTGFFSEVEEFERHIANYEKVAREWEVKNTNFYKRTA